MTHGVDRDLDFTEPDDARLDAFLREAIGPLPEVDWAGFRSQVAASVEAQSRVQSRARSRRRLVLRLSVPLAAAAAVAFYVGLAPPPSPSPSPEPIPVFQVAYAPAESIALGAGGAEDLIPVGRPGTTVRFEWPETASSRRTVDAPRRALLVTTYGNAPVVGL